MLTRTLVRFLSSVALLGVVLAGAAAGAEGNGSTVPIAPFRFTGTLTRVIFKAGPEQFTESDRERAAEAVARARD